MDPTWSPFHKSIWNCPGILRSFPNLKITNSAGTYFKTNAALLAIVSPFYANILEEVFVKDEEPIIIIPELSVESMCKLDEIIHEGQVIITSNSKADDDTNSILNDIEDIISPEIRHEFLMNWKAGIKFRVYEEPSYIGVDNHERARAGLCLVCLDKSSVNIEKSEYQSLVEEFVVNRYDIADNRFPTGLCSSCSTTLLALGANDFSRCLPPLPPYKKMRGYRLTGSAKSCPCILCSKLSEIENRSDKIDKEDNDVDKENYCRGIFCRWCFRVIYTDSKHRCFQNGSIFSERSLPYFTPPEPSPDRKMNYAIFDKDHVMEPDKLQGNNRVVTRRSKKLPLVASNEEAIFKAPKQAGIDCQEITFPEDKEVVTDKCPQKESEEICGFTPEPGDQDYVPSSLQNKCVCGCGTIGFTCENARTEIVDCHMCNRQFEGYSKLRKHLRADHIQEQFQCPTCNKEFLPWKFLTIRTHMKSHKQIGISDHCVACGTKFVSSRNNFRGQMLKHKRIFGGNHNEYCAYDKMCPNVKFSSFNERIQHVEEVHDGFMLIRCGHCQEVFGELIALKFHVRKMHKNFKCECCRKRFPTPESLEDHKNSMTCFNRTRRIKRQTIFEDAPSTYPCHICGKMVKERRLKDHAIVCQGLTKRKEERQVCAQCGKNFRTLGQLNHHTIAIHVPMSQRPWPCNLCEKRFASKLVLQNHIAIHENKREHKCTICGLGFNDNANTRQHMRRVHKAIL